MNGKIKRFIKNSQIVYTVYFILFSLVIRVVGIFIRTKKKQILFFSLGGRAANDSPRSIYEYMIKENLQNEYKLIWAVDKPDEYKDLLNVVNVNSFSYFIQAQQSGIWITNSSIERGLSFKKKHTRYINTWHGTPLKKMGTDLVTEGKAKLRTNLDTADFVTVQSEHDVSVFTKAMGVNIKAINKIGLPRNDSLYNVQADELSKIKVKLNILNDDAKIILYAPTQREYRDVDKFNLESIIALVEKLPENYLILYRSHYSVSEFEKNTKKYKKIIDVSKYENNIDLMKVSDLLITDYSSILFDYALTGKPILIYSYDIDEYKKKRGMYFNIEDYLEYAHTVDELSTQILTNNKLITERVYSFQKHFKMFGGSATKLVVNYIKGDTE